MQTRAERRAEIERLEVERDTGFVYLMRSENGYHKIGITKNVAERLKGINYAVPMNIELVHSFSCRRYTMVESFLHYKYADKLFKNEWFSLNSEDVAWICSIVDNDPRIKGWLKIVSEKWHEELEKKWDTYDEERRLGLRKGINILDTQN